MSKITCQTCGAQWDTTDEDTNYWFRSSSFNQGDYASPKDISDAAEDMTYCPKCQLGGLKKMDERLGGGDQQLRERGKYDPKETAGPGNSDVTFGPES